MAAALFSVVISQFAVDMRTHSTAAGLSFWTSASASHSLLLREFLYLSVDIVQVLRLF